MTLLTFINDPARPFTADERHSLRRLYAELDAVPFGRLIARNIDRECDRSDVQEAYFIAYLRDLAVAYRDGGGAAAGLNPFRVMEQVYAAREFHYRPHGRPPGIELTVPPATMLVTCLTIERFAKWYGPALGLPLPGPSFNSQPIADAMDRGQISGTDIVGSPIGLSARAALAARRVEAPVWVTTADEVAKVGPPDANRMRDALGLHHVDDGHLMQIRYDASTVTRAGTVLAAPTVLATLATRADNWVFAKRATTGGPEWGHTLDLGNCGVGVQEAVHSGFDVTSAVGARIAFVPVGPVTVRASLGCTHDELLARI